MVLKKEILLICVVHLLENKEPQKLPLNPLMEIHWILHISFRCLQNPWSMFTKSVEEKIENPMGRLSILIKCTTGETQELVKRFINNKPEQGYRNAMELLRRQYAKLQKNQTCHQSSLGIYQHLENCLISWLSVNLWVDQVRKTY